MMPVSLKECSAYARPAQDASTSAITTQVSHSLQHAPSAFSVISVSAIIFKICAPLTTLQYSADLQAYTNYIAYYLAPNGHRQLEQELCIRAGSYVKTSRLRRTCGGAQAAPFSEMHSAGVLLLRRSLLQAWVMEVCSPHPMTQVTCWHTVSQGVMLLAHDCTSAQASCLACSSEVAPRCARMQIAAPPSRGMRR